MADLLINGNDAFASYGVRMDKGFIDALMAPAPMKPFVSNKSRLEGGKRVVVDNPRVDERDIMLNFTIQGTDCRDFAAKLDAFFAEIIKGPVNVNVPALGSAVYHLIYNGKSSTYAMNTARTFARMAIKFNEPNPADRT